MLNLVKLICFSCSFTVVVLDNQLSLKMILRVNDHYQHDNHDDEQGDFDPDGGRHVVVLHPHHDLLLHCKLGRYDDDGDDDDDDLLQPS